eukprot:XP_001698357.1 predicted protein [Chlamydomonas reinhardtii]
MGRLFRKLTANLGTERRRRSSSDNVADPGSQPPAASAGSASAALASTISRRNKRASAPGEIFFSVGSGSAADVPSPPQGTRPGSAVAAARDGITKGKNWLARLSRGLTTASSGHGSSAAGVTPPRPATAHPAGGGGGGGGSARSSSPLPPVAAGAVVAEAPRSPHHHSGPVGRALGLFARRSDPPAAGASAAGGPEPAKGIGGGSKRQAVWGSMTGRCTDANANRNGSSANGEG